MCLQVGLQLKIILILGESSICFSINQGTI